MAQLWQNFKIGWFRFWETSNFGIVAMFGTIMAAKTLSSVGDIVWDLIKIIWRLL